MRRSPEAPLYRAIDDLVDARIFDPLLFALAVALRAQAVYFGCIRSSSSSGINRNTGHRIKYMKVDADTGDEVANDDIMKGYKVDTDTSIEVSKDELENIALESPGTIDINEFVPKADIDPVARRWLDWC